MKPYTVTSSTLALYIDTLQPPVFWPTRLGDNTLRANLFGNRINNGRKKEVLVLIKPTIIRTA
ncbi:hypothetical protein [Polaromonas vacuolata]|uniref:hypothetical protein n=1 Tax=Polaromonas vacuolata TaxID=37448 RepID=UPI001456A91C|nr:hypothetical protein [Polaromonas vacuolata]